MNRATEIQANKFSSRRAGLSGGEEKYARHHTSTFTWIRSASALCAEQRGTSRRGRWKWNGKKQLMNPWISAFCRRP